MKRALIGVGVAVVLFGGAAAIVPPLLFSDGVDYSKVTSIEREPAYQNAALLEKAFALPVAAAYKKGGLDYQGNGSFCGPTTAVDVLRSLEKPTDQAHVLDGTDVKSTFGMVWGGLTLEQEAGLLRAKTGRKATVLRPIDLTQFRAELMHTNDPGRRYAINFHRGPLFGRGGGHHSPIGGYLAEEDLVLVLDVNEKFQPWLVKSERLFEAVNTVDKQAGHKRGLVRIE